MEDEMNSVANCLRNTFLNKIPSEEEIAMTCHHLAEKLALNNAARNDVKLALMDVLEEALQGTCMENTVKSRYFWVVGRLQKVHKIEIINKIEIFYLLLVPEAT